MTFYEALSIAMREKGITAAELSIRAGVHQSYLSKLKNGHTKDVTWEKALAIIAALEMTPDEFSALQHGKQESDD